MLTEYPSSVAIWSRGVSDACDPAGGASDSAGSGAGSGTASDSTAPWIELAESGAVNGGASSGSLGGEENVRHGRHICGKASSCSL